MAHHQVKPEGDKILDELFDELINEKEAAALLGVTVRTLQVWRSTKRYNLPYVKIGRAVRYKKRSSILAFITARTIAA